MCAGMPVSECGMQCMHMLALTTYIRNNGIYYNSCVQVCQYESNTQYYSLGRVVDRIWTVNSMDPLTFTIRYTGGDIAGDLARYVYTCTVT